jgi:uncharacterized protein (DUF488 family)
VVNGTGAWQGIGAPDSPPGGAAQAFELAATPAGSDARPGRLEVLTIGHSTRKVEDFISRLRTHRVTRVADVRTIPRSRHNPQFNRESLETALQEADIGYVHLPSLGGLRHPRSDSLNSAWRNSAFRGFADHMQTEEFLTGIEELLRLAKDGRVAVMCAEAVPWRCHRSLIADALLVRGVSVLEIASRTQLRPHALTRWAHVEDLRLTYPPQEEEGNSDATPAGTAHERSREDG